MIRKFVLTATVLISSLAFAGTKAAADLDGRYAYLAIGEDYKFSRIEMQIKDGKMILPTADNTKAIIEISEGAQDDFIATLKGKALPPAISLYKMEADFQGSGELMKLTLVKQTMNNTSPRLTVYWVDTEINRGRPVIQAYDKSSEEQMKALDAAEEELK
jgi:hypothetical protein